MHIVTEINEWKNLRKKLTQQTIGFVPTMGHLHQGHASLCQRSIAQNEITVVSIFVNPAQFNQKSDFDHYPISLEEDKNLLSSLGVDYVFIPTAAALYPDHYQIQINETELSQSLEGMYRPGHFNGMMTIVLKLLNLMQPSSVYFGEKDYQQFLLVKKMVEALFLPIAVIPCETIRAEDGLPLSSRNTRLSAAQREKSTHFSRLLKSSLSVEEVTLALQALGFKVDYIAEKWQRRLGAVWVDDIRLIDNISLLSMGENSLC